MLLGGTMIEIIEEIKDLERRLEDLTAELGDKRAELEMILFQLGIRE